MTPLAEVLSGRDERAALQREWLSQNENGKPKYFLCQIGLNIPGFPKRVPNDMKVIKKCRDLLTACSRMVPEEERFVENGAGVCWQGAFSADKYDPALLKKTAVDAENTMTAGRIFDIDILTATGNLSRRDMGLPERKCLLCGERAKSCARLGTHSTHELREIAVRLLTEAAIDR